MGHARAHHSDFTPDLAALPRPPALLQFCELLMLPTVPPWKRAQRAAEEAVPAGDQLLEDVQRADEAAERQHAEATAAAASAAEAAAAAAAAAAGGELESLDAFLQQAAGEEAAPAGASDAAENMLEDPELAGSSEAAAGGGSAPREAPAAIAAEIDLDAVQEAEEAEEEEAERRQAAAASAAAQQDAAQGAEQSEGEESEEGRSLYPSSEGFGQRALAGEVSRAEERRLRRLDRLKARQEAMGDRWQPAQCGPGSTPMHLLNHTAHALAVAGSPPDPSATSHPWRVPCWLAPLTTRSPCC